MPGKGELRQGEVVVLELEEGGLVVIANSATDRADKQAILREVLQRMDVE